jgi:hypothetical protein
LDLYSASTTSFCIDVFASANADFATGSCRHGLASHQAHVATCSILSKSITNSKGN